MSVSGPAAPSSSPVSTAITALRAAGERGDADAVAELLAPDVVFHSPMTERLRFEGREEVAALHRDIFAVLDDTRHHRTARARRYTIVLLSRARSRGGARSHESGALQRAGTDR